MQPIIIMKKINLILVFSFIITLGGCIQLSKTAEEKTMAVEKQNDPEAKITASSQLTMPQDTQALHKQRIEEGKKYLRNNWTSVIHVKKGAYKTGMNNTGISKLTVEVENTTMYAIDSIKILVPYYAHGECIKSEYVKLKNIPAEGKSVVNVPDNKNATSFQVQVRKVNSAAMQLCFDIDDPNREGDDPYKCK